MRKSLASIGTLGFVAAALFLNACSTSDSTGTAGSTGSAGSTATAGTGGTVTSSEGGTTGTAGAAGTGAAGTGAAGTGTAGTGTAGTGTAGTGTAGTGGSATAGTGGFATAGSGGTAAGGTGGTAAGGAGGSKPPKMSAGCNQAPPTTDKENAFIKHDLMVTGVSASYIAAHPLPASDAPYTFTMRNYYVKLPVGYMPSKPYRVQFGGGGCGGPATVGSEGGYLPSAHTDVLEVAPSYVPTTGGTTGTNPGGCYADSATDTPDLPYFDAMLAQVEKDYCVDTAKVGVSGYSSGAWFAIMLGWARAGVVRGIATEAGGLRHNRPAGSNKPVAALMIATNGDTENPINLVPTDQKAKDLGADGGSAQARDEILMRNGCTGTATAPWDATYPLCQKYTGCPAAYPVVWCLMTTGGHYPAHTPYTPDAMAKFLGSLPDVP